MAAEQLTIRYQSLTPLYTGNRKGEVDRLHETGVMGSLRWWLEVLVRGIGGLAHDPTQGTSSFNAREFGPLGPDAFSETARLRAAGLDDVSQVFGATGWRRRFRLNLDHAGSFSRADWNGVTLSDQAHTVVVYGEQETKIPRWPLKDFPFEDNFDLSLFSLDPGFDLQIVGGLLSFIEEWAGIGAKNQFGMGVIQQIGGSELQKQPLFDWLNSLSPINPAQSNQMARLPSLGNLFLARIAVSDPDKETTFRFKTKLRRQFTDSDVRHFVMGTIKGGRQAAKIKMSMPYGTEPYTMRVWGWLPHQSPKYTTAWPRDKILDTVRSELSATGTNLLWREFDSYRDTKKQNETDQQIFLHDLLGLPQAEEDKH